jgi:hypothetical protein
MKLGELRSHCSWITRNCRQYLVWLVCEHTRHTLRQATVVLWNYPLHLRWGVSIVISVFRHRNRPARGHALVAWDTGTEERRNLSLVIAFGVAKLKRERTMMPIYYNVQVAVLRPNKTALPPSLAIGRTSDTFYQERESTQKSSQSISKHT